MQNALLVIDIQAYYLKKDPSDLPQKIVNHQEALNYDLVLFTVFQNDKQSNMYRSLKWDKASSDEDAKLPEEFKALVKPDNVFKRNTFSAFKNPRLHEYLQKNKVERLVLCGNDIDACVLATAFEAFDLGYKVKVEFSLTRGAKDLETGAQEIIRSNLMSRD